MLLDKFSGVRRRGLGVLTQKIFGFLGFKTHGFFFNFEASYPMFFFSMVVATSSDRTILSLPPVEIAQP